MEAVAYAMQEPLSFDQEPALIRLPSQDENELRVAPLNTVTPGYFGLIGTPIVRGRGFTDAESRRCGRRNRQRDHCPPLLAGTRRDRPNAAWRGRDQERALQVVGVTRDAQIATTRRRSIHTIVYVPAATGRCQTLLRLLVRSRADFATTAAASRSAVRELDPGRAVRVHPLESNLEQIAQPIRRGDGARGFIGCGGSRARFRRHLWRRVVLRRPADFVRLESAWPWARDRATVLGLILTRTMRPVVIGAAIGIAAGIAASRVLSSILFGVSPVDPVGLGGATLFVSCVALAAGILAGRHGTRVDPMVTLRYE